MLSPDKTVLGIPIPLRREIERGGKESFSGTARLRQLLDAGSSGKVADVLRCISDAAGHSRDDPSVILNTSFASDAAEILNGHILEVAEVFPPSITDLKTLEQTGIEGVWKKLKGPSPSLSALAAITNNALRPSTSEVLIKAKQDAYKELLTDTALCNALDRFDRNWGRRWERDVLDFAFGKWPRRVYRDFWKIREAFRGICARIEECPEPESPYLQMLFEDILAIKNTRFFELMDGGIVRTPQGLKTEGAVGDDKKEKKRTSRFLPWPLTPAMLFATASATILSPVVGVGLLQALEAANGLPLPDAFKYSLGTAVLAMAYVGVNIGLIGGILRLKADFDTDTVAEPLREIAAADDTLDRAVDAIGRIGELLAGVRFIQRARVHVAFPHVYETSHHFFIAKGMGNPECWFDPGYVTNDINLCDYAINTVTGANSGGKTSTGCALLLNQLFAQMSLPIPCVEAHLGVAEWIGYQAPESQQELKKEGRFGGGHARARDVTFPAGRRSMVVLDELAEGTTSNEVIERAREVLEMLASKGTTVFVITQNLELAHVLEDLGMSQNLEVEFNEGVATYRMKPGIATSSHSEAVAARVAFSKRDILAHLNAFEEAEKNGTGNDVA